MGRPSDYNKAIAELICERLADGESLRKICADEDFPSKTSVFRWLAQHKEFRDLYARAKDDQIELLADELTDIADEVPKHFVPDPDGGESERIDSAGIQRNKLRVDTRKWVLSKRFPKKYGDNSTLLLGGDGGDPIKASIAIHFVKTGTDASS